MSLLVRNCLFDSPSIYTAPLSDMRVVTTLGSICPCLPEISATPSALICIDTGTKRIFCPRVPLRINMSAIRPGHGGSRTKL